MTGITLQKTLNHKTDGRNVLLVPHS